MDSTDNILDMFDGPTSPSQGNHDLNIFAFDDASDEEDEFQDGSERLEAIARIEAIVASLHEQLADADAVCLELHVADRMGQKESRTIKYPRGFSQSGKSMAQALRVLDIVHECLVKDVSVTKRDIFYRDVPLFKVQSTVDKLVDDFAATFGTSRGMLNVRATSKGLVCGSGITITTVDGRRITPSDTEGVLIPAMEDIADIQIDDDVGWVLVVEKDAVFQTLARLGITKHKAFARRGIIITGKGYPDIATRQLVKALSDNLPKTIPLLGLMDGDVFGLDILSVYKFGSKSLRHFDDELIARRIKWLGLGSKDCSSLNIDPSDLLPMKPRDYQKASSMLQRPKSRMPDKWRQEIMTMVFMRRKTEIEVLLNIEELNPFSSFIQWLAGKVNAAMVAVGGVDISEA